MIDFQASAAIGLELKAYSGLEPLSLPVSCFLIKYYLSARLIETVYWPIKEKLTTLAVIELLLLDRNYSGPYSCLQQPLKAVIFLGGGRLWAYVLDLVVLPLMKTLN